MTDGRPSMVSVLRVVHSETGTSDLFLQDRLWQFYQRLEADVACTRELLVFTLHSVCVVQMFQLVSTCVSCFTFICLPSLRQKLHSKVCKFTTPALRAEGEDTNYHSNSIG